MRTHMPELITRKLRYLRYPTQSLLQKVSAWRPRPSCPSRTDPAKNARRAMVRPCPRCSAPVLTGLDDDWCAMTVAVDLAPLTNHTEALALISGRHTYEVTWNGPRGYHIDKRPIWHISNYPAGDKGYADGRRTIHAEHRCDTPITTNPELPPLAHHNTNSYIIPDKPPF